jgi:diaminopimelate epimerase
VPHAILFVENLEKFDVECWGESIRHHRLFKPRGANADFVKVRGKQLIEIRTYERGVEGETLACGTGATASALVVAKLKGFRSPITVLTKGTERLKIYFRRNGDTFQDVCLEGKVLKVFEGRVKDV